MYGLLCYISIEQGGGGGGGASMGFIILLANFLRFEKESCTAFTSFQLKIISFSKSQPRV